MSYIIPLLIGAIPILTYVGMCGLALYFLTTENKAKNKLERFHNHPDKNLPLYNVGHCDRYSAGTFSW